MGDRIEPFNLREEREDGFDLIVFCLFLNVFRLIRYYDEEGNYVWKEEEGEPDSWCGGLKEVEMEKQIGEALTARRRVVEERRRLDEEQKELDTDPSHLKRVIVGLLQANEETPVSAMKRLKGEGEKKALEVLIQSCDLLLCNGVTGSSYFFLLSSVIFLLIFI